jgi:ectoine hydroxylase-related dioxygenase (phytanoyl-CoA dioxygenase family)
MVAVGKRRDAFFRHWSVSYVSHDWMRTTRRVVLMQPLQGLEEWWVAVTHGSSFLATMG